MLIELKKSYLYVLSLMLAVFLGALFVNAYGSGGPATYVGHSPEELYVTAISIDNTSVQARVSSTCGAGSSIRAIDNNGGVTCETDDTGGVAGKTYLISSGVGVTVNTIGSVSQCCPGGPYGTVSGGGCDNSGANDGIFLESTPSTSCFDNNGWSCRYRNNGTSTHIIHAHVICIN